MRRLLPDPTPERSADELLAGFEPYAGPPAERPYTYTNFALTVDGRATIEGRSGPIGTDADTELLVALRMRADAVLIGAGTMRAELYGRTISDPAKRALRERRGLPHDPLTVIISGRLDLPWDAPLFTEGAGRVLIFTVAETDPPPTVTRVRVARQPGDRVDLRAALRYLRTERGIRSLLCEGGPRLHAGLLAAGLVDELFVTRGPVLAGGSGPTLLEGLPEDPVPLELAWLLAEGSELYARYRVRR